MADIVTSRFRLVQRTLMATTSAAILATVPLAATPVVAEEIEFWSQPYGDLIRWQQGMNDLIEEFTAETGIEVNFETINWSTAFANWLTVAQGGAAPDCADMFWLHSFSGIGGNDYGPMPINEFQGEWPTIGDDFFPGSLTDVNWQGDFYGIPWRVDIRPQLYSKDAYAEAGLSAPPANWDDVVSHAKALTKRDDNGNVTRWGYSFGMDNPPQALVPFYWQSGGNFMSEDGKTATIDNDEMRQTLQWMRDMVWEHQVVSPDFMEPSFDPQADFISGNLALIGSVAPAWGRVLDAEYPELDGTWAMAVTAMGPENRQSYSGAGYWGVLRGTDKAESCVKFIEFLSRPDSMQKLSEVSGNVSPRRAVMASDFWSDADWKVVLTETLEHGRTSQHPSSVWSALMSPKPGGVIYDMMYDAIIVQNDIDEVVSQAQVRMQEEMDRAAN
ncbi:ABC transporter substrate-binding protein [Bauldia sp.]|uniref:ABC transporter substrate-binding protein n=1 Tax=Bauldia sp. TaxID=2575872 RepID=UPI003BAD219C